MTATANATLDALRKQNAKIDTFQKYAEAMDHQITADKDIFWRERKEGLRKPSFDTLIQKDRVDKLLGTLPYKVDNVVPGLSPEEVYERKNNFIYRFRAWSDAIPSRSVKREDPESYAEYLKAICDGIENGDIVIEKAQDLFIAERIFIGNLSFLCDAVEETKYFAETGAFMDILEFFGEPHPWQHVQPTIFAIKKLYAHEISLKRASEIDGTTVYADFLSVPIEIKASFAGCDPTYEVDEDMLS